MANAMFVARCPAFRGVFSAPVNRGSQKVQNLQVVSRQRLTTDSLGSSDLTINNVIVGSRIRVEIYATGIEVVSAIAAGTSVVLSIPYFTNGDSKNNLRIKIRNASSSPTYQPYETQAVVSALAQSIFANQLLDE